MMPLEDVRARRRAHSTRLLLEASIMLVKQRKLIAAQKAYIELLREKLRERDAWVEANRGTDGTNPFAIVLTV